MVATQRSGLWGFIILLGALAFLRSLAPEHTEHAVRGLMNSASSSSEEPLDAQKEKLKEMTDELKRERIALERLKKELDLKADDISDIIGVEQRSSSVHGIQGVDSPVGLVSKNGNEEDALDEQKESESSINEVDTGNTELNTAEKDDAEAKGEEQIAGAEGKREKETDNDTVQDVKSDGEKDEAEAEAEEKEETDGAGTEEEGKEETGNDTAEDIKSDYEHSDHDVEFVELTEDECPIVVVPEFSKSGLGTQIEHLWTSLSVTLAIRNACIILPPVVTDSEKTDIKIVPFHEIFDIDELGRTGLRILPLSACKNHGIESLFDDNGAETAIVKNFIEYVKKSHPNLAQETVLVNENTKSYRFPSIEETEGDVNKVAKYIYSKLPEGQTRSCVGFGRVRSSIAFNLDVVEHFQPAPSIDEYVTNKYSNMNDTVFVKLRWNKAHCEDVNKEDGSVCLFTGNVIPVDDYIKSIAYAAMSAGATRIYVSTPLHVPENISAYLSSKLALIDPVLLEVGSDFFTATIIEREMAVRARVFVPDGGAWDETVQESRKMHYPHLFKEGYSSLVMVQEWKNAGSPADLAVLKDTINTHETEQMSNDRGPENPGSREVPSQNVREEGHQDKEIGVVNSSMMTNGMSTENEDSDNATDVQNGNNITANTGGATTAAQLEEQSALEMEAGGQRPNEYLLPQGYIPNDESDEHLFADGQIPQQDIAKQG